MIRSSRAALPNQHPLCSDALLCQSRRAALAGSFGEDLLERNEDIIFIADRSLSFIAFLC